MHHPLTHHLLAKPSSLLWLPALMGLAVFGSVDRWYSKAAAQDAPTTVTAPAQVIGTTQSVLIVNPASGDDATAEGSDRAPFKTITQALQVAQPGTVILLTPGTYSQETGESFPLRLKPAVALQGNAETRGQGIVIQGSGLFLSPTFARQNIAILGADRATLTGVTVKNPNPQGYGLWVESTSPAVLDSTFIESGHDGISVTGTGSPLIRNNYFYQNGANGITIYGTSRAEVRENIFEQTGFAININQKSAPLITGNRITQNKDGIVVQASAQPILRNNSVDGNTRDGLVAIARSRPDLGTAAEPGGNSFRNNGQFDVNVKGSSQQIPAFGNDLDKTAGNLDLAGTSLVEPASSSNPPFPVPANQVPGATSALPNVTSSSRPVALAAQPTSSDKSTSSIGGKTALLSPQKQAAVVPMLPISANPTVVEVIPFGQQFANSRSTANREQTPAQPLSAPAATAPTVSDGISAASFPVPAAMPTPPASPLQVLVVPVPARAASEPAFPVPSASPPTHPIPVVRIAAIPSVVRDTPATSPQPVLSPLATPMVRQISVPLPERTFKQAIGGVPGSERSTLGGAPLSTGITSKRRLSSLPTLKVNPVTPTRAIEIPVPAPEARSMPAPVLNRVPVLAFASVTSTQPTAVTSPGLLPVPNPDAPIGNVGSLPSVNVYRNSQSRGGERLVLASNRSVARGLPFKVVVEALDDSQQAQVRAAFPNAFRTSLKGQTVMQVAAFGDRAKAEQLMQTLSSQGMQAKVATVE